MTMVWSGCLVSYLQIATRNMKFCYTNKLSQRTFDLKKHLCRSPAAFNHSFCFFSSNGTFIKVFLGVCGVNLWTVHHIDFNFNNWETRSTLRLVINALWLEFKKIVKLANKSRIFFCTLFNFKQNVNKYHDNLTYLQNNFIIFLHANLTSMQLRCITAAILISQIWDKISKRATFESSFYKRFPP